MATSIQILQGNAQAFNDLDLIALICLVEERLEENGALYPALEPVVAAWRDNLRHYGPGTIALELDRLSASERNELESMLRLVRDDVMAGEERIPASILNERCKVDGVVFTDYASSLVTSAIARLLDLLHVSDHDAEARPRKPENDDGIPTRNRRLLASLLGRRLTRLARLAEEQPDELLAMSSYAATGVQPDRWFALADGSALIGTEDVGLFISYSEELLSVTVQPLDAVDTTNWSFVIEANDARYAEPAFAHLLGKQIASIDAFEWIPDVDHTDVRKGPVIARKALDRPREALLAFVFEDGTSLWCVSNVMQLPGDFALLTEIDPKLLTSCKRVLSLPEVDPLQDALDQLLGAYFEGTLTRAEVYEQMLALVPTHGADAVFAALPPPWKRTFFDWAKRMYDNDIPLEQFISIGSPAPKRAIEAIRPWLATHHTPPADPPTPAHVEQLFIYTPDDLDFSKLDTQTLFELAIQRTEPFLATTALGELTQRSTYHARDAAETVLRRPIWDHFHTSYAIGVLYSRDPQVALELMTPLLESDDPVVLDEMVDVVLGNSADFAKPKRRDFARRLAERVAATAPGDFTDRERRARFLTQYGAKES